MPAPAHADRLGDAAGRPGWVIVGGCAGLLLLVWGLAGPLSWAPEPIGPAARQFAEGARTTLALTAVAGTAGLALGVLAALGRQLPGRAAAPLRWACAAAVELLRGTPLLVQVLFVFFALPELLPWLRLDEFAAASLALALNVGAYNAEAVRAGLQAVPRGQIEAARALGLRRGQAFRRVVWPQALQVALPGLANNAVALLKDSSLAYAIGVVELTQVGNRVQAASFQPVHTLTTTALVYLAMTLLLSAVARAVERYQGRGWARR